MVTAREGPSFAHRSLSTMAATCFAMTGGELTSCYPELTIPARWALAAILAMDAALWMLLRVMRSPSRPTTPKES